MSAETPVVEQQQPQAPTTLSFKWMVDPQQFMQIPGAKKVRINRKLGSAVVEFESPEAAAAAVVPSTLAVTIDSRPFSKKRTTRKPKKAAPTKKAAPKPAAKQPKKQKAKAEKKPRAPRAPREPRTSVLCTPDVSAQAADASKLVLLKPENTVTGGRLYQNKPELETKHVASLKFAPVLNSVILPQVNFGPVAIDVDSIRILPEDNGNFAAIISVLHPETGHRGVLALKRFTDPEGNVTVKSTRSFNLLVNPEDKAKAKDEEVPIHFISIESINVDPQTGLWADLQLALDVVNAPFYTLLNNRKRFLNRNRKSAAPQTPE